MILLLGALVPVPSCAGGGSAPDVTSLGVLWQSAGATDATLWSVRWSPDGGMLAATYFDNTTRVFNSTTGNMVAKIEAQAQPAGRCDGFTPAGRYPLRVCAWSPDGKLLAMGGDDRSILIYNVGTWDLARTLKGHRASVLTLDFSPDGRYLASGSGTDKVEMNNVPDENVVRVWDVANGTLFKDLGTHKDGVMEVKWSPDGRTLVSVSDDKSIKVWNAENWTLAGELRGHTLGVLCADFSPNGLMLVTGSRDYTVRLWDLSGLKPAGKWDAPNCVRSVDWHPGGELIAVSGVDEVMLTVRQASDGVVLRTFTESGKTRSAVMSSRWSPDGKQLASGAGKEATLRVYAFGLSNPAPPPAIPSWLPGLVLYGIFSWTGVLGIGFWGWRRMERDRR
jgi:WD40 repeat protein